MMRNDRLFKKIILSILMLPLTCIISSFTPVNLMDETYEDIHYDYCEDVQRELTNYYSYCDEGICCELNIIKMNEVLKTALSQWNYKAISGSRDNPEVVKYFKEIGYNINDDETPWCSAFLNWCAMKSGYEYTTKLTARSWSKIGNEIEEKDWSVGDVVVLWRSSPRSWKGHVGLYIRHDEKNIYLLGGNQSKKVTISCYKKDRVLNVRRLNVLPHDVSAPWGSIG